MEPTKTCRAVINLLSVFGRASFHDIIMASHEHGDVVIKELKSNARYLKVEEGNIVGIKLSPECKTRIYVRSYDKPSFKISFPYDKRPNSAAYAYVSYMIKDTETDTKGNIWYEILDYYVEELVSNKNVTDNELEALKFDWYPI